MKAIKVNKEKKDVGANMHFAAWFGKAKGLEKSGAIAGAIAEYLRINKKHPFRQEPYDRLMVLYRKTKDHAHEEAIISAAIHRFKNKYGEPNATANKKVVRLSKSLSFSLGLTDRKGALLYDPGPIGKWLKRKKALEKIMNAKK